MKRPLAWIGFSASAAFLIAGYAGVSAAMVLLFVGLAASIVIGVVPRLRVLHGLLAVCLSVSGAMGVFWYTEQTVYQPLAPFAGQTLPLTLSITGEEPPSSRAQAYTAVVTEGTVPSGTKMVLWVSDTDIQLQPFDVVTGTVALFPAEKDASQMRRDKAEGTLLAGSLHTEKGIHVETPTTKPWYAAIWTYRQAASDMVSRYLSGPAAAMVKSLCLGDRRTLPDSMTDAFRTCGASHLLVVSGLHLSMVAGGMRWLLRRWRVRRRPAAVFAMLTVLVFMVLVGFTPSVKRAGVMMLVLLAGDLFRREADGLNSLGLSLLLMGIGDPYMVWDVGLQLSVGATAGILLLYPRLQQSVLIPHIRDNPRRGIRLFYRPMQTAAVSLSAMAILPLLMVYFGEVSLLFLPANICMSPLAGGIIITGMMGLVLGGWCPFAGQMMFGIAGGLSRLIQVMADGLSHIPFATVSTRQPYIAVWVVLTAVILCLFWKRIKRWARVITVAVSVVALVAGSGTYHIAMRPITTCTFLDVEEGAAALMEWENGRVLAVTGDGTSLMRQVTAALSRKGIDHLQAVVLPDLDDSALAHLPVLTSACRIEWVVCPETGRYASSVRALFPEDRRAMAAQSNMTIGDDHQFDFQNGWLRACAGDTRFLFAPAGGDAACLPDDWKQTHMATLPNGVAHPDHIVTVVGIGAPQSVPTATFPTPKQWYAWGTGRQLTLATRGEQDISVY